jgi:hypothetical protein
MEAADELLTISALAIALAGFSGVVAAFGHRNGLGRDQRFFFYRFGHSGSFNRYSVFCSFSSTLGWGDGLGHLEEC